VEKDEFTVPLSAGLARKAAVEGLKQSGLGLRFVEDQGQAVVATTTASIRSFGETITVKVDPLDAGHSKIQVRSASAAALIDWGKNADNVRRVKIAIRALTNAD